MCHVIKIKSEFEAEIDRPLISMRSLVKKRKKQNKKYDLSSSDEEEMEEPSLENDLDENKENE